MHEIITSSALWLLKTANVSFEYQATVTIRLLWVTNWRSKHWRKAQRS
jgi:hypothetical protein